MALLYYANANTASVTGVADGAAAMASADINSSAVMFMIRT